jgi:hypothetical protein
MLVTKEHLEDTENRFWYEAKSCSFCGEALTPPYVFWHAATDFAFHLRCAHDFASELYTDYLRYKLHPRANKN